jgi:hypothetical protein
MAARTFQPGDQVIWLRNVGGGFVFPLAATVVAATPKRVTITAEDPDEKGEGLVTRHVKPANLQHRQQRAAGDRRGRSRSRGTRQTKKLPLPAGSFEAVYPHIASWVEDGWIEVGRTDWSDSFVRALDSGGLVWEGKGPYASPTDALRDLDDGIAAWLEEMG